MQSSFGSNVGGGLPACGDSSVTAGPCHATLDYPYLPFAIVLDRFRQEIRNEPIILAHHPLCGRYDDHFFIIRGRKVCRGCLTVYPTAAVGAIALILLGITDFEVLLIASLALFSVNLSRLVLKRTKWSNVVFNVILGLCLSTTIFSMLNCPAGLVPLYYPFVIAVYFSFMIYRGHRMLKGCRQCPHYASFPACFRQERAIIILLHQD